MKVLVTGVKGQLGYDIVKECELRGIEAVGVEHNIAAAGDICFYAGTNTGLHIIAGDGQILIGVEQQTLQRGDRTFLRHGAAGNCDGILQKNLFTAEFHHSRYVLS